MIIKVVLGLISLLDKMAIRIMATFSVNLSAVINWLVFIMKKFFTVMSIALASATMLMPSISHARPQCYVDDSTGTPLNVRSTPNGQVIGRLKNGEPLFIIGDAIDSRGRAWLKIIYDTPNGGVEAYIYGEYYSCLDT